MKIGPVTNLDKRNKTASKKIDHDVISENCDATAVLGQSRSRIPDAQSVNLIFSLIVTFYLTKNETDLTNL